VNRSPCPIPHPPNGTVGNAHGLYDPCLALRLDGPVQRNDLRADETPLIIITGANQGGKSTFLRSLGLAQLMTQAAAIDTDDLLLCKSGARRGAGCAQYGSCAPPAPCRR
jgi:hypothetical protein